MFFFQTGKGRSDRERSPLLQVTVGGGGPIFLPNQAVSGSRIACTLRITRPAQEGVESIRRQGKGAAFPRQEKSHRDSV